jgi:C-terminal processing protease CtpA/Prc
MRATARSASLALAVSLFACAEQRGTIGAVVGQAHDGRLYIRETPAGLAAEKAGLQPDDEILLIDGRDVRALTARQVHQALSGDVGEPVKLTVIRGEEVIRVTLRRTPARKHRVNEAPEAE